MKKLLSFGIIILTCGILAACGGGASVETTSPTTGGHDPSDCTTAPETTEAPETEEEELVTDRVSKDNENGETVITETDKKTGRIVREIIIDPVYKTEKIYEVIYNKNLLRTMRIYMCPNEFWDYYRLAQDVEYEYDVTGKTVGYTVKVCLGETVVSTTVTELYSNGEIKINDTVYTSPSDNVKREVEEYDETGKLVKTTKYDENGNIIE